MSTVAREDTPDSSPASPERLLRAFDDPLPRRKWEGLILFVGFLAFVPLDLGSTALGLHLGAIEANPYAAGYFSHGILGWVAFTIEKLFVVAVIAAVWGVATAAARYAYERDFIWVNRWLSVITVVSPLALASIGVVVLLNNIVVIISLV